MDDRKAFEKLNFIDGFERVYTVSDYYDGPRSGIADFKGQPHFYKCVFSEREDDYTNEFELTPISQEALELALEEWAIWNRWQSAFYAGNAMRESHPALPEDESRHKELASMLDPILRTDPARCVLRYGMFRLVENGPLSPGRMRNLEVRWTESSDSRKGGSLYR